jgi:hypothetical protein
MHATEPGDWGRAALTTNRADPKSTKTVLVLFTMQKTEIQVNG